uniref:MTS domain-containing protein n=1 Tax=Mesocestoides corti TaxID=53468 RepID=A0A5K3FIW6_MESCO
MSLSVISKKKLYMKLQCLESFSNPKQHLEQYPTSSQVAGDILFDMQTRHDALNKKTVADLGCGAGMLTLGAHLLGASFVVGFDIDRDAIADSQKNLESNFPLESAATVDLVLCDVTKLTHVNTKPFDTVILNPPFGANDRSRGIDVEFLKVALGLSRNHVYSLHKTTTRKHIMKTIQELGAMCEVVAELRFDIPRMYKKHRQLSKDIAVDFFHSWFERSNT